MCARASWPRVATKQRELLFDKEGIWSVDDHREGGRWLMAKATGGTWNEYYEYLSATKTLTPLFGQDEKEEYQARFAADASEILVKRDEPIKRGQVIGKAGQTGNVATPQLHFEIRKGSTPVDPAPFLAKGGNG